MKENAGYIGKIKVRSMFQFIVYGKADGVISEHATLEGGRTFCEHEHIRQKSKQLASDALLYEWKSGAGWKIVAGAQ